MELGEEGLFSMIEFPSAYTNDIKDLKTSRRHSNLVAKFFWDDHDIRNDIVFSPNLKSVLGFSARQYRYSFFEIVVDGIKGLMHVGDRPYFSHIPSGAKDIKLVLVSQFRKEDFDFAKKLFKNNGIRIYPFPLPILDPLTNSLIKGKNYEIGDKQFVANMSFSTSHRKSRLKWVNFAESRDYFYSKKQSYKNYFDTLDMYKLGVSLRGVGVGGKCYRETEYITMGFPLVLDYDPIYPFEFRSGKQYIKISNTKDLEVLQYIRDEDIERLSYESKEMGRKYLKPASMITLMKKLARDYDYVYGINLREME